MQANGFLEDQNTALMYRWEVKKKMIYCLCDYKFIYYLQLLYWPQIQWGLSNIEVIQHTDPQMNAFVVTLGGRKVAGQNSLRRPTTILGFCRFNKGK